MCQNLYIKGVKRKSDPSAYVNSDNPAHFADQCSRCSDQNGFCSTARSLSSLESTADSYATADTVWTRRQTFFFVIYNLKKVLFVYRISYCQLTLKTPRKPASENDVCLCRLLNILANFSNQFLHTGKQCGPRSDCS